MSFSIVMIYLQMNLLLCDKMSLKRTIQPITVHMLYVFRHLNRWSWNTFWGPSWPWSYGSWIYNYLSNQCLSPLLLWVRISIRARCTTLCNKVCQWLAIGRWFSLGPPLSTNKIDRHDIAEILLKVALNRIKPNQTKP